jgi:hypothetical protein
MDRAAGAWEYPAVTRPRIALTGALLVLLVFPVSAAHAAWSTQQQVKGFLSEKRPAVGVDETGTVALGLSIVIPAAGASYVERPPGLAEWNSAGVKITQITGAPPSTVFALSSSGAAVATWATGASQDLRPWAAYKPPGGKWGAGFQLDTARSFEAPIPLIDEAGHAAVVWARKTASATHLLNQPNQVVYSVPTPVWPASPTKIADITTPLPHDENPEDGFSYNRCGEDLHAAILPDGTPVASWNDDYGSWKQTGGVNDGSEHGLCSVRAVLAGGAVVDVTPRPNAGFYAAPAADLPSWSQSSLVASGTNTKTATVLRGRDDSVMFSGCSEGDACANGQRETRVALGTGSSLALGGSNLLGINEIAAVALRNERTLVVSDGSATVLRAGVGIGFPSLAALPEDFQLISAGLALNDAGAAHVAAIPNNLGTIGLRLFDAPGGGAFAGPQVVDASSGANRTPSLALDCKGLPVMAWSLSSNQIYASSFDTAPSVCGSGPEPEPEGPKPGGGGGGSPPAGSPSGPTVTATPPPVPSSLATLTNPKVDSSGSKVKFEIVCSSLTVNACGGKVVIRKSTGGKARVSAKAKGEVIGSSTFSGLKPGKSLKLKIPLVKSAKQALKAGKSLKVTITAAVHDGNGVVRETVKAATLRS